MSLGQGSPPDLCSDSERSEDESESGHEFHEEDVDREESGEYHHSDSGPYWQESRAN